jgi:hypothetical protein
LNAVYHLNIIPETGMGYQKKRELIRFIFLLADGMLFQRMDGE